MLVDILLKDIWLYADILSVVGRQNSVDEVKHIGCILRKDLEDRATSNGEAAGALAQETVGNDRKFAEKMFGLDTLEKKAWFRD